ncbi:DUF6884 domain-containing protein [Halorarum halobium]|uniref:DUF6884 domain-containing protein n=1 Tax=Halorarum halobium TaxID=3075121 RepID=UPI0028A71361|nr:DUF6884 domain-containing protein [Halobaculum sp. XH14]
MRSVGLVQAIPNEPLEPAAAGSVDDTEFFRLKREFARTSYDDWLVLAADAGVLGPAETVTPDGTTIEGMEPAARARWAMDVVGDVAAIVREQEYEEVAVLASRAMRTTLNERGGFRTRIGSAGASTSEPLAGFGGAERQQQWLTEQLEIRRRDRS